MLELDVEVEEDVDVLVEVDVLVLVEVEVEVLVEVLDDDEVEVHVKSEFPNRYSLIWLSVLCYDYSCSSTLRTAIQRHVVLYRKNPYFSAADSRPVFDDSRVVKG